MKKFLRIVFCISFIFLLSSCDLIFLLLQPTSSFKATFLNPDGTVYATSSIGENGIVSEIGYPVSNGTFIGWSTSKTALRWFDFSNAVFNNVSLYAVVSPHVAEISAVYMDGFVLSTGSTQNPVFSPLVVTAAYSTSNSSESQNLSLTYLNAVEGLLNFGFPSFEYVENATYTITVNVLKNKYEYAVFTKTITLTEPVAVSNLQAETFDSGVTLTWVNGNSLSNTVEIYSNGILEATMLYQASPCSFYGLQNGTNYTFKVITKYGSLKKSVQISATPLIKGKEVSDYLLIMYMDGDNDLNDAIYMDLNEVEKGLSSIQYKDGSAKPGYASINVVALWDGYTETSYEQFKKEGSYIFALKPDENSPYVNESYLSSLGMQLQSENISYKADWLVSEIATSSSELCGEVNMGSKETLSQFLQWVNERYEAEKIILQFSNHGGGPRSVSLIGKTQNGIPLVIQEEGRRALCWDYTFDKKNAYLKTKDVENALQEAGFGENNKIDLMLMDVCLGASVEDAYQFRKYIRYLAASPNTVPGLGNNYIALMKAFTANSTIDDVTETLLDSYKADYALSESEWKKIIAEYVQYGYTAEQVPRFYLEANAYSIIDVTKMDSVYDAMNEFAQVILGSEGRKSYLSAANSTGEVVTRTYSEHIRDTIFTAGYPFTYPGTFTYLFDIGKALYYVLQDFAEKDSDGYVNQNYSIALCVAAENVQTALDSVLVKAWRDRCYDSGISEDENDQTYGLTISGATIKSQNGIYVNGLCPSFYQTDLAFGTNAWADVLEMWF